MSELDWKPPWCDDCNDYCGPADGPCRCCLAAEVEALRAQVQRVREMHTIDQCPRCAEFHCLECGCEGVYTEQVSCRTTRVLDGGEPDE